MKESVLTKKRWAMLPVIFALAWPTMFEQLMQTAVQYIDTAMVGSLGTQATAAVGSTATISWLVGSSVSALGIGFLSFISQACGAGDRERVRKLTAQSVLVMVVVGLFFTALTFFLSPMVPMWMQVAEDIQPLASRYFMILYLPMLPRAASIIFGTVLRSAGDTKTPMRVSLVVNLVNVVLNYLLIYPTRELQLFSLRFTMPGAGWGVEGAAIASAIAFTVGGVMITAALWKHPLLSPKGGSLKPDVKILRPCLRVAFPNMLQRFATSLGYVAFAALINSLGEVSAAAHTIANTVESAFYIPAFGMQTAAATLAGNALGANDRDKMREFARMIIFIELVLMLVSGSLLFVFAPDMAGIFSDSAEVILLCSAVLKMVAVSEPFYGVAIIIEGILLGLGNTVLPFVLGVSGMWGIRIVGTYICTKFLGQGLVAAWGCMIGHNMLLFAAYLVYYSSGRWNPLNRKKEN